MVNPSFTPTSQVTTPSWIPWMMLPARTLLFVAFQALFAAGYLSSGSASAWKESAAWWPFTVTLTNLVCVALLISLFQREGKSFPNLFRFQRQHWKNDLLAVLGVLVITIPAALLPMILLGTWLFGDSTTATSLLIRHLPSWAAIAALVLFPITQGLVELAFYFMYIEPRLEEQVGTRWLAVSLSAFALGIQHLAIPLIFNGHFMVWRSLMFIPFAFLLGIVLRWRPRLLPYLAVIHILLDLGTAALLLTA